MTREIVLPCPAKVNLSLRVHGRRGDGYHEVSTVLQTIDVCDRLSVRRLEADSAVRLRVPGGGAPTDEGNLVLVAARAFLDALGEPFRGVGFELEKRIPAGSGLGGGSSDAAASLLALQELWGRPLGAERLAELAAGVGSDVPFFLRGGTALATGRGEKLQPLDDVAPAPVVVAVPPVEVSTAEVYGAWSAAEAGEPVAASAGEGLLPPPGERRRVASWLRGNDLEPVVRRLHPEVDDLLRTLHGGAPGRAGVGPQVTGSGGAVFGIGEWPGVEDALEGTEVRLFRTVTRPRFRGAGGPP